VSLEKLPLTPNGKLDRRALPKPEDTLHPEAIQHNYTSTERLLCEVWKQILNLDEVGVDDNFFEFGGHSLSAMKLVSKVTERCNVRLTVASVFRVPTVRQMAQQIDEVKSREAQLSDAAKSNCEEGVI
jgi:acyl carrier protein